MTKQASALKVGTFVLAGLFLIVVAIVIVGAGRLFTQRIPFILYFGDSVNGLVVGASVKFKGVPIGTVKRIQISLDEGGTRQYIPVLIELNEESILSAAGQPLAIDREEFLEIQIKKGLRASLEAESFITGRLYVQLDYYTNAGTPVFVAKDTRIPELPTISTGMSEFIRSLERVDLAGMSRRINEILDRLTEFVGDIQVREISQRLIRTLDSVDRVVNSPELAEAVKSVTRTSDEARRFLGNLDSDIKPVTGGLTKAADEASRTLVELRATIEELRGVVSSDSPLLADLAVTLEEFARAARSVRQLSDFLTRNPRAILTGRKIEETRP